jgi:mRNA interferase MazF
MKRACGVKRGSIQLVPFPFTDLSGKKVRPALVLGCEGDDMVVVFISSVKPKGSVWVHVSPSEENGIKVSSYIRYTKIATLDVRMSIGEIGVLEESVLTEISSKIARFLGV